MDFTPHADANPTLIACAGEALALDKFSAKKVTRLSSQVVAAGDSAINGEGVEQGAAGARELVAVPSEVGERGLDGAAGVTDWDM